MIQKTYTGVILAGGQNSRYGGQDKAFIEVEGKSIINRIIESFSSIFEHILIVTNRPESYGINYENHQITSDHYKGIGPLGGIHAAMKASNTPNLFIVSCDMPWVDSNLVNRMIQEHLLINSNALIPSINDNIEPLHAIYQKEVCEQLENHIENQEKRSIRSFLNKIDTQYYSDSELLKYVKSFANINSPEDFNKYL